MSDSQSFDLIIYGATGFTGRLVAEYVNKQYGNGGELVWAMAGRSAEKLASVRDEMGLPADTPLVVADSNDEASMREMVNATKVVLTTVGPYQMYGSELVRLCAEEGTDYVDLCGESVWMREMIDTHGETAKKSGARIVHSCGFDSIPSDLGILYLQNLAESQLGSVCQHISGRVRAIQGGPSGGTLLSMKASIDAIKAKPELYALAVNHYCCVPGFKGVEQPDGDSVHYDEALGSWVAPFVMAAINTRVVHRSNALLGHRWGENFTYDEMMLTGPGEKGEQIANHVAKDLSSGGAGGSGGGKAPKPGEGPSKEERENGFYDLLYIGKTADGQSLTVNVKGDRDPGYGSTSKMIAESAVCLIKDATDTQGGFWTPAPAMGEKLIKRLQDYAGLTFKQV